MKHCASWIVAAAVLLLPACNLFDDDDVVETLAFETVSAPGMFVGDPMTAVWRSEQEWNAFYCVHDITDGPICTPPTFDFDRRMLIGVFWGHGYSGCSGNTRSIERILRRSTVIEVALGPLDDLGDCEALVTPTQIVRVQTSPLPVVFTGNVAPARTVTELMFRPSDSATL